MPRGKTIYFPEQDYDWYNAALETLANDLITDDEAGQRGQKSSIFIRMLLTAYIRNGHATVEALRAVKEIAAH